MERESFMRWLTETKGLKRKSAGDVASRIKRVAKIINVDIDSPYESIIESLVKSEEYDEFSIHVKSQVKRAVKLYKDFQQSKK